MVKKIRRGLIWVIATCNVLAVIGLLVCSYSDHLHPSRFPLLSISGLLFPIALACVIAFLLLWLFISKKGMLISVIALILCLPAIRVYFPINRSTDKPEGAIKVLSYNVWMYGPWGLKEGEANPIVEYILKEDADIVCLQEASSVEAGGEKLDALFKKQYPYYDVTEKRGGECMTIYSKFPILSKDTVNLNSKGNLSVAYLLDVKGEEVLVINNHLETAGLNEEDKENFEKLVKNDMPEETAKNTSRSLIRKLMDSTVLRASQADKISKVIQNRLEQGKSVIVCGDFNDTPLSYTRRTIAKGLTDCFVSAGNGLGFTYQKNRMYVRIDHILCSDDWIPYGAKVDKEVDTSDHFPVTCWLKKQSKH